jgi:streptogramin lyase
LAISCAVAGASTHELRARVSPTPNSLTTRSWSPTIVLTESGRPASERLTLTIRKRAERRSFRPRATRRGSYRVRVVFPSDGRWSWTLAASRGTLARGAVTVSGRVTFDLPYDLAVASDGTLFLVDRSRVLALDPRTRRFRVHATLSGATELVALERLADGTLFVTDLPGNRVLRIDPSGRVAPVAKVAAPADLVADKAGRTIWVASIADGVGVVRVDVATGRVQPFATPFQPHGIDRDASGDFVVHDGHSVSRIDGTTGIVSPFAEVDAFKLLIAPDARIYGVEGSPRGGRVVRIAPDGDVTIVAGTGTLGPHRDGPALEARILPTAVELASAGSLLVAQVRPIPAIRRIDLATGQMTTVARGR